MSWSTATQCASERRRALESQRKVDRLIKIEEQPPERKNPSSESREFTRALVDGDDATWREFYHHYAPRLRAYLSVCWQGESDAVDDLLQNTMLRTVKHIRVFDSYEILWSWLTVLARSSVTDYGRKRSRFFAFLDLFREHDPRVTGSSLGGRLALALTKLNSADQNLIKLKYEEKLKVREIATALDTSEKTIESRLTRCRKRLRKHLNRLEP